MKRFGRKMLSAFLEFFKYFIQFNTIRTLIPRVDKLETHDLLKFCLDHPELEIIFWNFSSIGENSS